MSEWGCCRHCTTWVFRDSFWQGKTQRDSAQLGTTCCRGTAWELLKGRQNSLWDAEKTPENLGQRRCFSLKPEHMLSGLELGRRSDTNGVNTGRSRGNCRTFLERLGGQKQKEGMTCLQLEEQQIYLAPGKVAWKLILKAQYGVNNSLRSK